MIISKPIDASSPLPVTTIFSLSIISQLTYVSIFNDAIIFYLVRVYSLIDEKYLKIGMKNSLDSCYQHKKI